MVEPYDALVTAPPLRSPFRRLARTHAAMTAGDAAMVVALADSVLFSLDPDAARTRVLLFLAISFVPFLVVAPLIGPAIDRMAGGRRLMIQLVAVGRVVLSVGIASQIDTLLLFPLAFGAMILQKTYVISKSALVPSVVRDDEALVEANSKLGLIAGLVGAVVVVPAALVQRLVGPTATLLVSGGMFVAAFVAASALPRVVVAAQAAGRREERELHADSVVLAAAAMMLLRASVGFTFFHLFFWYRGQDAGLAWFGLSVAAASISTMTGNALGPAIRRRSREETMLLGSLVLVAVVGVIAAVVGRIPTALLLAGAVNLSAAVGRLAFESIVQRDAPDANRGRAFAQFETRFQLAWVVAGTVPVLVEMPGKVGFGFVAITCAAAALLYGSGGRAPQGRTRHRSGSVPPAPSAEHPMPPPVPRSDG